MTSEMYWTIVTLALQALLDHWDWAAPSRPDWLTKAAVRHALEEHTPFVDPETRQAQQLLRDAAARVARHGNTPGLGEEGSCTSKPR